MATAAQNLADAKAARHKLVTGQLARVFMDQNGERVEFNKTSLAELDVYIRGLEAAVNPFAARRNSPRPIGFIF